MKTRKYFRLAALILCAGAPSLGASFQVTEVPVEHPEAQVFLTRGASNSPVIAILDGYMLRLYNKGMAGAPVAVTLRPGTTAIDIADTTGFATG